MNWRERIVVDPAVCGGEACIRGTQIRVSKLLHELAAGVQPDELLKRNPQLAAEDIRAALAYAAEAK